MTKNAKISILVGALILTLIGCGLYFLYYFFSAFAPPKIIITKDYIKTDGNFINGVMIEKLLVDSFGDKGYPVKYTTYYTTSCNIHHPRNKPPNPPDKIEFYKSGNYSWDEDTTTVQFIHIGLTRQLLTKTDELWWLNKFGDFPTCPMKIEKEQWYFFTFHHPQITGIFYYIDKDNKEHQYYLASGVSPI